MELGVAMSEANNAVCMDLEDFCPVVRPRLVVRVHANIVGHLPKRREQSQP